MYRLTDNPDSIIRIDDGATIPRGHRWWDEYETWLDEGNTPEPPAALVPVVQPEPEPVDLGAAVVAEASAWLDRRVKERGYDNIVSCISYINSTDELFRNEAIAASAWRDALYRALYDMQTNPPAGVTTVPDAIRLLPQPENYGW